MDIKTGQEGRTEEIKKTIAQETQERQRKSLDMMLEQYNKNQEIYIDNFVKVMDNLFKECVEEQKRGRIKTGYIDIWSMRLSVENGSYEYPVRLYAEGYYHDKNFIEKKWNPGYMEEFIKADILYFEKLIMLKIIRAKKYEVKDFLREYIYETYIKPVPEVIKDRTERLQYLESFQSMEKAEEIPMYYGEMMEEAQWEFRFKEMNIS